MKASLIELSQNSWSIFPNPYPMSLFLYLVMEKQKLRDEDGDAGDDKQEPGEEG